MTVQNQTVTLLIVTSETREAERLTGVLRTDGLAAKSVALPNAERLDETIAQRDCDMILCCSHDRNVDLDSVLAAYRKLAADLPLIVIGDAENRARELVKVRRGGARDLLRHHDDEHLKLAVAREFAELLRRREASGLNAQLQLHRQRDRELFEVTSAGVAFVQDGLHLDANPAYLALFGYPDLDELQAIPFLDLFVPAQQQKIRDLLRRGDAAAMDSKPLELSVVCQRADASQFATRLLATPDELDRERCLRVILYRTETAIEQSAAGAAPARPARAFELAGLLAEIDAHIDTNRMVKRPFMIFYLHLKQNAHLLRDLGLTQSLERLNAFADNLASLVAERGFLARVCDDGFSLIVDGLSEYDAKAFAERLVATAHPSGSQNANKSGAVSDCAIGYYLVRDRAAAAEDILNAAHRLCLSQDSQISATSLAACAKQENENEDVQATRRIEEALRQDRLRLVYQPIISLMGDNQENYSVLARLLDEDETLHEAKDFIGAAIRGGLIEQIDKWAIRSAIQIIGEQRREGHNISFFINLSEDTFRNPNVILWICDCLREFDVRGNWLTFQFQEELVASNLASIGKLVETLKRIKCRIAVNRFGSVERPELLLQGLSLDYVLLQPSFAFELADDPEKQQRLIALATLAHEFNVKTVVTGVEDARALTVLWTAGVDYVQGNFLQRPSPTLEVQS